MSYYSDEDTIRYYQGHKYTLGKDDPHIPNKFEGKLLRRLMSENNMTEDEVRSIKKYRKLLSEESKKGEKSKGGFWKNDSLDKFWKRVTKRTGLVREHPVSKYFFNVELKEYSFRGNMFYWGGGIHPINLSKKDLEVLENYDLTKL